MQDSKIADHGRWTNCAGPVPSAAARRAGGLNHASEVIDRDTRLRIQVNSHSDVSQVSQRQGRSDDLSGLGNSENAPACRTEARRRGTRLRERPARGRPGAEAPRCSSGVAAAYAEPGPDPRTDDPVARVR